MGNAFLEWRHRWFGIVQQAGNFTNLRVHAGGDHDPSCRPRRYIGVHKAHVVLITQHTGISAQRGRVLINRHGFTSQGGLFDLEVVSRQKADVGRKDIARFQQDHVADHQFFARQLGNLPITPNVGRRRTQLLQRRNRVFRLRLLKDPKDRIQDHHH